MICLGILFFTNAGKGLLSPLVFSIPAALGLIETGGLWAFLHGLCYFFQS